jgi:hypothetical protein
MWKADVRLPPDHWPPNDCPAERSIDVYRSGQNKVNDSAAPDVQMIGRMQRRQSMGINRMRRAVAVTSLVSISLVANAANAASSAKAQADQAAGAKATSVAAQQASADAYQRRAAKYRAVAAQSRQLAAASAETAALAGAPSGENASSAESTVSAVSVQGAVIG